MDNLWICSFVLRYPRREFAMKVLVVEMFSPMMGGRHTFCALKERLRESGCEVIVKSYESNSNDLGIDVLECAKGQEIKMAILDADPMFFALLLRDYLLEIGISVFLAVDQGDKPGKAHAIGKWNMRKEQMREEEKQRRELPASAFRQWRDAQETVDKDLSQKTWAFDESKQTGFVAKSIGVDDLQMLLGALASYGAEKK